MVFAAPNAGECCPLKCSALTLLFRNLERIPLACGGKALNSLDDLEPNCLGFAEVVYEHVLGDDKYTFIEGCKAANSCTILVRGRFLCVFLYPFFLL